MAEPVMTQILGTSLDYRTPPHEAAVIERALADLSGKGFSLSWDASPAPWTPGLLEHEAQLNYCRNMASRLERHGMGAVFVFSWRRLLPRRPTKEQRAWFGETLDPATGTIAANMERPQWNFGCSAPKAAFSARSRALFQAVGPFHMFLSDEQIMGSPGGNSPHYSGKNFQAVKRAALRHGKKWGGMIELSHYGHPKGVAPQAIIDTFKANVEAGASIMLVYAGANFRSDRRTPNDTGAYYLPDQVAAWEECVKWLEAGRKARRVVAQPRP